MHGGDNWDGDDNDPWLDDEDDEADPSWCDDGEVACRVCGCTEDDCSACVERTGSPCFWAEVDLCSACARHGGD